MRPTIWAYGRQDHVVTTWRSGIRVFSELWVLFGIESGAESFFVVILASPCLRCLAVCWSVCRYVVALLLDSQCQHSIITDVVPLTDGA